jgi:Na+-driven multidrug efflux pump
MHLIGAHAIGIRIEALSFLPGFALSLAAATMAGQYLGAGDPRMAGRAIWTCWLYAAGIMGGLGILFMVMPRPFVLLMTDQPEFIEVVPMLLFMAGWSQIGLATSMVLSGALRGAGDVRMSMLLMLGSIWLIRVPAVWLAGVVLDMGLVAIWFATSIELFLRGGLFLWRFVQGGWKKLKI